MPNMTYCMFENTLRDLDDCYNSRGMFDPDELSESERRARRELIRICSNITADLEYELDSED